MKLTKKDLKDLMKECIREVLKEEGVVLKEQVLPKSKTTQPQSLYIGADKTTQKTNRNSNTSNTNSGPFSKQLPNINPMLSEAVNALSSQFRGKDAVMMAEIFADTALTTLQEQNSGHQSFDIDGMGSYTVDNSENPAVNDQSLKSLTGDGDLGRWARVAFANNKK